MPSAWPASASRCSKFGSLMTPTPISTAAAIATSSPIWNQRACLCRRAISQPASTTAAASQVHFMPPPPAGSGLAASSRSPPMPKTVGPEPLTIACCAPASRSAASAGSISGHSRRAAGSRSLTYSNVPPRSACAAAVELVRRARAVVRVELAVDLRGGELRVERDHDQRRLLPRQRLDVLTRAGHQRPLAAEHHGHVRAEPHRQLFRDRQPGHLRDQPQRRRRVARPAGHARRDRDALDDRRCRCGGAVPPGRRAELAQRPRREVVALDARADHLVAPKGRLAALQVSSSARSTGWTSETSGWRPSARGAPTSRQRLTLPGANTPSPTARASRRG